MSFNPPILLKRPRWGPVAITDDTFRYLDLSAWYQPTEVGTGSLAVVSDPADGNITFGVPSYVTGSPFAIGAIMVPFTVGIINDTDYAIALTWATNMRPLTTRYIMLYVGR